MQTSTTNIPKVAMQSIAGGLLLMALFTFIWSGIAAGNLATNGRIIDMITFFGTSLMFIGYAIYFFTQAKRFTTELTEEEKAEGKRSGIWFGIIFGLEGILIPIAVGICLYLKQPDLIIPSMALVVGLHFYPMAPIFKRTIDYYLGTWATGIAIGAMVITLKHIVLPYSVIGLLGVGMALTTTVYGLNMIRVGKGYLAG